MPYPFEHRVSRLRAPLAHRDTPADAPGPQRGCREGRDTESGGWRPIQLHPPPLQVAQVRLDESLEEARAMARRAAPSFAPPWFSLQGASPQLRGERLPWLPVLAHPTSRRTPGVTEAALQAWERWLATDLPGHGVAWLHTTDIAARVLHQVLALIGFGPMVPGPLRRRIAGSAAFHLGHLEARLAPSREADPRRLLQLCGLVGGDLAWPLLSRSPGRLHQSLADLGHEVEARLGGDGAGDLGSPSVVAEVLLHLLVVRALVRGAGEALPSGIEGALVRSLPYVEAMARVPGSGKAGGHLLPVGPIQPVRLIPLTHGPVVWLLRALAESQHLHAPPTPQAGLWPLGGFAAGPHFHAWSTGDSLGLAWFPNAHPVLAVPREGATPRPPVAGPMEVCPHGQALRVRSGLRTAFLDGHTLVVRDASPIARGGPPAITWTLAPGWHLSMRGSSHARAVQGSQVLDVELDPGLTWHVGQAPVREPSDLETGDPGRVSQGPTLVGHGQARPATCRFTVRAAPAP